MIINLLGLCFLYRVRIASACTHKLRPVNILEPLGCHPLSHFRGLKIETYPPTLNYNTESRQADQYTHYAQYHFIKNVVVIGGRFPHTERGKSELTVLT